MAAEEEELIVTPRAVSGLAAFVESTIDDDDTIDLRARAAEFAADTADSDNDSGGDDESDAAIDEPVTLNLTASQHLSYLENLNWMLIHRCMDDQLQTIDMAVDAARDTLKAVVFLLKHNRPLLLSVGTKAAQSERDLVNLIPAVYALASASQLEQIEAWVRDNVRRRR